jgi:hypothetical protein
MKKIVYFITGKFYEGMTWEDFYPHDSEKYPNFYIASDFDELDRKGIDENGVDEDGCINIEVKKLTKEIAILSIAKRLGVLPDMIELIEQDIAISS